VDVVASAEDALRRSLELLEADCPVDLYLMVGVGAANAGELVVAGRGIAFVCLEHFTGVPTRRRTAWDSRRAAAAVDRPRGRARAALHLTHQPRAMRRLVGDLGGGGLLRRMGDRSRATLRELVVNEPPHRGAAGG